MKRKQQHEQTCTYLCFVYMSADRSIAVPRYRKEGYTRADLTYNYTRQNKHTADLFDGWDNGVRPQMYHVATITGNYYDAQRFCTAVAYRLKAEGYTVRVGDGRQQSMAHVTADHPDWDAVCALDLGTLLDPKSDLYATYVPTRPKEERIVKIPMTQGRYTTIATNASLCGMSVADYMLVEAEHLNPDRDLTPLLRAREGFITTSTLAKQAYICAIVNPGDLQPLLDLLTAIQTTSNDEIEELHNSITTRRY